MVRRGLVILRYWFRGGELRSPVIGVAGTGKHGRLAIAPTRYGAPPQFTHAQRPRLMNRGRWRILQVFGLRRCGRGVGAAPAIVATRCRRSGKRRGYCQYMCLAEAFFRSSGNATRAGRAARRRPLLPRRKQRRGLPKAPPLLPQQRRGWRCKLRHRARRAALRDRAHFGASRFAVWRHDERRRGCRRRDAGLA